MLKMMLNHVTGRVEDIGVQTVMPGDDAETQVNFPKLPRLVSATKSAF